MFMCRQITGINFHVNLKHLRVCILDRNDFLIFLLANGKGKIVFFLFKVSYFTTLSRNMNSFYTKISNIEPTFQTRSLGIPFLVWATRCLFAKLQISDLCESIKARKNCFPTHKHNNGNLWSYMTK